MNASRLTARLYALIGLATTMGAAALLMRLGVPVGPAVTAGAFLAGAVALAAVRLRGRGAADDAPLAATGVVMFGLSAVSAMMVGKESWPTANALLLFLAAIAVEVLLWRLLVVPLTQGVVRSRQADERRAVAAQHGWHVEPTDADLPALLGPTRHLVSLLAGRVIPVDAPVPDTARATDVVTGTAGGVAFTAFDLSTPRRLLAPKVSTAWLVRLPHALPPLTSAEVLRQSGVKVTDPGRAGDDDAEHATDHTARAAAALATAVLSDDVVQVTRERLPSWWINGSVLAASTHAGHRAPDALLVAGAEAITWLASILGSPQLTAHAVQATAAGGTSPTPPGH
jgi:hypothetical protein